MIYSLSGKLKLIGENFAVIECGGVGMKCVASKYTLSSLSNLGSDVEVYTYMAVREDSIDLYGFSTVEEKDLFTKLLSVNSVGPKAAISILSLMPPTQVADAISSANVKMIQAAPGIGKKTAERIVLDLKDKVGNISSGNTANNVNTLEVSENQNEAIEVLKSLGYSKTDATQALASLDTSLSVDDMIRQALKILSNI